jgi:hypothetical protein
MFPNTLSSFVNSCLIDTDRPYRYKTYSLLFLILTPISTVAFAPSYILSYVFVGLSFTFLVLRYTSEYLHKYVKHVHKGVRMLNLITIEKIFAAIALASGIAFLAIDDSNGKTVIAVVFALSLIIVLCADYFRRQELKNIPPN